MSPRFTVDPSGDLLLQVSYEIPCTVAMSNDAVNKDIQLDPDTDAAGTDNELSPDWTKNVEGRLTTTEIRELLVSSKVLSVASPVFRVMLDGRFTEGAEMQKAKKTPGGYLPKVELLNDDAEAMMLLCKVLHFNIADIPTRPKTHDLERLAIVCDAYDCTTVLKYCGALWLRNWIEYYDQESIARSMDDLCRLFIFAYVADLENEFSEICWRILLDHKGPLLGDNSQAGSLLDHELLEHSAASKC
jgi:hypothetical protein